VSLLSAVAICTKKIYLEELLESYTLNFYFSDVIDVLIILDTHLLYKGVN
jgi:hypothetical protein